MCWPKTYPAKEIRIENSFLASALVDVQDVNVNAQVNISDVRLDSGWTAPTDSLSYSGSPDRVRIYVNVNHGIDAAANIQRGNPLIILRRNSVEIARSSTGYLRDLDVHESSSNTISFVDPDPGTNPAYDLVSEQEGVVGVITSTPQSSFSAEAIEIESCEVLFVPTSESPEGGEEEDPFAPNDDVSVTFFNEQQFAFGFGLQNLTNAPVSNWSAQIANANYNLIEDELTNNDAFDLVTTTNPCLLYTSPSPRDGLLSRMPSSA